jgi:hypothetical protein
MQLNIAKEVAALKRMTTKELRTKYGELFGEPTVTGNRTWLVKRLGWRLQVLAEGGLSERARQRAAELADEGQLRLTPPKDSIVSELADRTCTGALHSRADDRLPPPGTILARQYRGELLEVEVLDQGFAFEGTVYKSLSAVAKAITGSHCNGFAFFRLSRNGGQR